MLPLRTILLRYVLLFLVCYLGLLGLSHLPPVRKQIKNMTRTYTGNALNRMLPDAIFISDPKRMNTTELPSRITVAYANKATITNAVNQSGSADAEVKLLNYEVDPTFLMGFFFFLSLLLVTPIDWKKKSISLLVGSVLLLLTVRYMLYVLAIQKIAKAQIGIYQITESQYSFYATIGKLLNNANIFVLPLIVWAATVFLLADWKKLKLVS